MKDLNKAVRTLIAALTVALAGTAYAGTVEETRFAVKSGGKTEVVKLGEMQVGEVRAIVTEGGTPAVVTRTETGVRLEVNNRIHEVTLDDVLVAHGEGMPIPHDGKHAGHDGKRIVFHHEKADGAAPDPGKADGERRVIKIVKHHEGDAPVSDVEIDAQMAEALAMVEADGSDPARDRVVVVRTVKKTD